MAFKQAPQSQICDTKPSMIHKMQKIEAPVQWKIGEVDKSRSDPSKVRIGYGGVLLPQHSQPASSVRSTERRSRNELSASQKMMQQPAFSQEDMKTILMRERIPDMSFDLDKDGSVGPRDFYIGTHLDKNKNLTLEQEELTAGLQQVYKNANGALMLETKPLKVRSNEGIHRIDGRTRTRSELVETRRRAQSDVAQQIQNNVDERINQNKANFNSSLQTRYPWEANTAPQVNWGREMPLDKISTKYPYEDPTVTRPKSDQNKTFRQENLMSAAIGARAYETNLEDWNVRRTKHLGAITDVNARILAYTDFEKGKPTFETTYGRTMAGGKMVINSLTKGDERWVSTQAAANARAYPNLPENFHSNPLILRKPERVCDKIVDAPPARTRGDPRGGVQPAGACTDDQLRDCNARAKQAFASGNEMLHPIVNASKFTYPQFGPPAHLVASTVM